MKKADEDEMLDEYDFTGGVRGKYVERLVNRKNVIVLEPMWRKFLLIRNRSIRSLTRFIADYSKTSEKSSLIKASAEKRQLNNPANLLDNYGDLKF